MVCADAAPTPLSKNDKTQKSAACFVALTHMNASLTARMIVPAIALRGVHPIASCRGLHSRVMALQLRAENECFAWRQRHVLIQKIARHALPRFALGSAGIGQCAV